MILGLYMAVSGLAMLVRRQQFASVIADLFAHPALMWVAGLLLMYLGGVLAFAASVPVWVSGLGWLILLKGATYILVPDLYPRLIGTPRQSSLLWSGVLVLLVGVLLVAAVCGGYCV